MQLKPTDKIGTLNKTGKNFDTFTIYYPWMASQLGLRGSEALVFALIYGLDQEGEYGFCASNKFIGEWVGLSEKSVSAIMSKLKAKKYIIESRDITSKRRYYLNKAVVRKLDVRRPSTFHEVEEDTKYNEKWLHAVDEGRTRYYKREREPRHLWVEHCRKKGTNNI